MFLVFFIVYTPPLFFGFMILYILFAISPTLGFFSFLIDVNSDCEFFKSVKKKVVIKPGHNDEI